MKLNENLVKEIKNLLKSPITMTEIASQYNVSLNTISSIKIGKSWSHVHEN
uniref:Uncharacterized protein n=1 Tax=viral metagenome TaxID=1070528 RepID=A0A6C0BMT5_9ZZZZ